MSLAGRTNASPSMTLALAATLAAACSAGEAEPQGRAVEHLDRAPPRVEAPALDLDIDVAQTSASGLSSGAFMAVQFHVAYSSIMRGVAAFAGGPFTCSQGKAVHAVTRCMRPAGALDPAPFVATTNALAAAGDVDPVAGLPGQRVFLFGGAGDTTIQPAVMDGLRDYYAAVGVAPTDLAFERRRPGTGHTMPTVDSGGDCASSRAPFVGRCGYDGAGRALEHIYGPLAPRAAIAAGAFVALDQRDFIAAPSAHSLADEAWAYVPKACASGARCRVHVAFHGCLQSASKVGDAFYRHAGYNEWADDNRIVVLYPQAIAVPGSNPNGCWDWWGYDSPDYAKKSAPQMRMVKAMIDRLAGAAPAPDADAPADAGAPSASPACVYASNAAHVAAGRARSAWGFAFARGSGQALGFDSAYVSTALTRVAEDVYVLGACR